MTLRGRRKVREFSTLFCSYSQQKLNIVGSLSIQGYTGILGLNYTGSSRYIIAYNSAPFVNHIIWSVLHVNYLVSVLLGNSSFPALPLFILLYLTYLSESYTKSDCMNLDKERVYYDVFLVPRKGRPIIRGDLKFKGRSCL